MTLLRWIVCCCLALGLAACSGEQEELRAWMNQQRAATPMLRNALSPPKAFEPFRYEQSAMADPFSLAKLALAADLAPRAGSGLRPDASRPREVLESFPLDNIKMVGHMSSGKNGFALVQVEAMIYQVRVGNYVGQNFGRVTRVTDSEVTLKELVQDAAGDWVERDTALRIQETRK